MAVQSAMTRTGDLAVLLSLVRRRRHSSNVANPKRVTPRGAAEWKAGKNLRVGPRHVELRGREGRRWRDGMAKNFLASPPRVARIGGR